jgi:AcrR family transcriptional regulator
MVAAPDARIVNMDARRRRIMEAASHLLAAGGAHSLTLREVAARAAVTVPTIYNLIGDKAQLIGVLCADANEAFERTLNELPAQRGLARAQAAVRATLTLCLAAPDRFGAWLRALPEAPQANPLRRLAEILAAGLHEAAQADDVHGRLQAMPLARHIARGVAEALVLWAKGALSPTQAEARVQYVLHVALMADATKQGRRTLLDRIRAVEQ